MNWTPLKQIAQGHRYFRDDHSQRIAVADQSGRTPDLTEDGILWVYPQIPFLRDGRVHLNVKSERDGKMYVVSDPQDGLADLLEMLVEDRVQVGSLVFILRKD